MSRKISKKNKRILISTIITIILFILIACGLNPNVLKDFSKSLGLNINLENIATLTSNSKEIENTSAISSEVNKEEKSGTNLEVYFIDVGQADSILIKNKEQSMLIDAGNNDDGNMVVNFIKEKGISKLNYVIGTHPHEDHIGGLDDVINNFDVENIYLPKIQTNTKTFESVLDAVANKGLTITSPAKGDTFLVGDAKCEIMTESIENKKNLNLASITIRLEFGNNSFLFMGDAETQNEQTRLWPKTDVLKVGHHGSDTSTSQNFLDQVQPKYAVIMVGTGNDYGHPKDTILKRLENLGTKIYRTDKEGTITMTLGTEEKSIILVEPK